VDTVVAVGIQPGDGRVHRVGTVLDVGYPSAFQGIGEKVSRAFRRQNQLKTALKALSKALLRLPKSGSLNDERLSSWTMSNCTNVLAKARSNAGVILC
jgi:hypothetical protein